MSDAGTAAEPDVLVGRDRELDLLGSGLEAALGGRGSVYLLEGEPGIGKTRLADAFAGRAAAAGVSVLWGRCWEDGGAPAYWPWIQALRGLGREVPGRFFDEPSGAATSDPHAARFRLFDAVATTLFRAAEDRPLAVVLDDLHAADEPSLLLFRFVATEIADSAVVLVAALRTPDALRTQAPRDLIADLTRSPIVVRTQLAGLSEESIRHLIERATGISPAPGLVHAIHNDTGGNALFVSELVKLLTTETVTHAGGARPPLPAGIRDVIARRLDGLSPACSRVLVLASIFGRSFRLDALARLAKSSRSDALAALDEAESAGLIGPAPGALGEMRFLHALVRDAVYESLPVARRMQLHLEAALALEQTYGDEVASHPAEIANHFLQAAPVGAAGQAVDYAGQAADRAVSMLAYEEGARLYEAALRALGFVEAPDPRKRCELYVALADARLKAGDENAAKEASLEAAARAREIGAPDLLARAALTYGGRFVWSRPGTDVRVVPLLEEALEALGPDDDLLRARVLARLAGALRDQPHRAHRAALSAEAVAAAERARDRPTLAYALTAHFTANWGPENADEQLAIATRLIALSEAIGDRDRAVEARLIRHKVLTYLGDINSARADLRVAARLAEESRQPSHRWFIAVDRVTSALFEGRFGEAEEFAPLVLEMGREALAADADVAYRLHMFALRREQGRAGEVEDLIRAAVAEHPGYPMFRCVLANLYSSVGHASRAAAMLDALAGNDFGILPRDNEWLFAMSLLPEVADVVGDAEVAARLFEQLEPFSHLHAYSAPELGLGSAARYVGLAALAAGRVDAAVDHLERALKSNEAMEAWPWAAHTLHDLARALMRRGGAHDERRARGLLRRCSEVSGRLGMLMLEMKVVSLQQGVNELGGEDSLVRAGDYWEVCYRGRTFRIRDSKGIGYLAVLLASPGREFAALDLATAPGTRAQGVSEHIAAAPEGDLGDVLDARAIDEFRRRLADLESDAQEARAFGDHERASRAEAERDVIVEALATSVGLGGRSRRTGGPGERARVSVTKAIRSALARIEAHDVELGRHLRATVHTGTFCSYNPDPRTPSSWRVARP